MLNHLNLGQYSDAFEENGHDDLNFLRELLANEGTAMLRSIGEECGMKPGHAFRFSMQLGQVPTDI